MSTILVSTHDLDLAGTLREEFRREGYDVEFVTAEEDIGDVPEPVLLVLTGGREEEPGNGLSQQARDDLEIPVFGVVEGDWTATRGEWFDEVFTAPVDPSEVVLLGRTLVERRKLRDVTGIFGNTEVMREVLERVVQIAPVPSTVLVTGESGTGKELVARGIHALSPRRHKPFIAVNVAALSETLLESELFGHEKGAFTGAVDTRRGFFELASGGIIFLDEIGEMPLSTQTKLLRVLEQKEFLRVGGEKPLRVDVRIIAATNRDLRELVAMGEFRRDLYYRLNVLNVHLPPLRERVEDVPVLVDAFIEEISESHDRRFAGISDAAMELLKRYHWPGNVRELRNLVESMVVLSPGREIQPEDIPEEIRRPGSGRPLLPAPMAPRPLPQTRGPAGGASMGRDGGIARPSEGVVEGRSYRPELEFIFRTLVELRMDMDDLRREFEAYKETAGDLHAAREAVARGEERYEIRVRPRGQDESAPRVRVVPRSAGSGAGAPDRERGSAATGEGRREPGREVGPGAPDERDADRTADREHSATREGEGAEGGPSPASGAVVYRSGMTMDDLEREAIKAALDETDGNRRKAAEKLGIGERTLYRKIRKYDLDV